MKHKFLIGVLCCVACIACTKPSNQNQVFLKGEFKNWALTPPMGWNSWDCYGPTVEELR